MTSKSEPAAGRADVDELAEVDMPIQAAYGVGSKQLKINNMLASPQQNIHVIAGKTLEWAIMDFLVEAAQFAASMASLVGAVKGIVTLPTQIKTVKDVTAVLKVVSSIMKGTLKVGDKGLSTAKNVLAHIHQNRASQVVNPGLKHVRDVYSRSAMASYLKPSGVAEILGHSTVHLMIISNDGKKFASFLAKADDRWGPEDPKIFRLKKDMKTHDTSQHPEGNTRLWIAHEKPPDEAGEAAR